MKETSLQNFEKEKKSFQKKMKETLINLVIFSCCL